MTLPSFNRPNSFRAGRHGQRCKVSDASAASSESHRELIAAFDFFTVPT